MALAGLGLSCGFMAWVWLWRWLNCYCLVLFAEAQKWLMIVVLIYEGRDQPLLCSVKAYESPEPHLLGIITMHAHAITINICFGGNRTAAMATVITTITTLCFNSIRTDFGYRKAITWVTRVESLSMMGGTISNFLNK